MRRPKWPDHYGRVGRLFVFLSEHPEGATLDEIADFFSNTKGFARGAVELLRAVLEDEEMRDSWLGLLDPGVAVSLPDATRIGNKWVYRLNYDYNPDVQFTNARVLRTMHALGANAHRRTRHLPGLTPEDAQIKDEQMRGFRLVLGVLEEMLGIDPR